MSAAVFVAAFVAALCGIGAGAWLRGWLSASAAGRADEKRPVVARFEISLVGTVVRTDVVVDLPTLERLANGLGGTLISLPSTAKH